MARAISSRARTTQGGKAPARTQRVKPEAVALHGPDWLLLVALMGLVSAGMIMVYSATIHDNTTAEVMRKMGIQFGMGAAGLVAGLVVPLKFWRKLTPLLLFLVFVALASLLVPKNPFAYTSLNATRWLAFGSLTVQPSEFAKLAFVLFAAGFLERRGRQMRLLGGYPHWGRYLSVLVAFAAVIYLEPDLGTVLVLGGIAWCMMMVANVDWKALVALILIAGMAVGVLAWNKDHQRARLQSWWNPWAYEQKGGHQVIQSWTALARGGLYGVGLGQSLQKLDNRLPEAETDFIFAVVAEETGLIGGTVVILFFLLFGWRGYAIAARAPDPFSALVAAGITSWVSVQTGLNLGVVTGTLPNTGVPLPFLSSGGSSLLALLTAVGILVAISRRTTQKREAAS